jgi:hypothetical protein
MEKIIARRDGVYFIPPVLLPLLLLLTIAVADAVGLFIVEFLGRR